MTRRVTVFVGAIAVTISVLALVAVPQPPSEQTAEPTPSKNPIPRGEPEPGPAEPSLVEPKPRDEIVTRLVRAGWLESTAKVVIAFHAEYLNELRRHDPNGFNKTLGLLEQLRDAGALSEPLTEHPELVGLFLCVQDPLQLESSFRIVNAADRNVLASLFLTHLDRTDADDLAVGIRGHEQLIVNLVKRGLIGAESLFLFSRKGPGAVEYERRVHEILQDAFDRHLGDDRLTDRFLFLLTEGPRLRMLMKDSGFRMKFSGIWGTLEAATNPREDKQPHPELTDFIELPGLWDFLSETNAKELLVKRGAFAADLLSGPDAYAADVRPRVAKLLLEGDEQVARLLLDCRKEPAFRPFLTKNVSPDVLRGIAADLQCHPETQRDRLHYFQTKLNQGDAALRQAVNGNEPIGVLDFVPLYSVYRVHEKFNEGDTVTNWDVAFAVADLGTVAVPASRSGLTLVKGAGKTTTKEELRKVITTQAAVALKGRLKAEAVKDLGRVGTTRAVLWVAACNGYERAVVLIRAVLEGKSVNLANLKFIDVTAPIQFVYCHSNLGRESFRRLTGLEARLFMREDAKVFLRIRFEGAAARNWLIRILAKQCGEWKSEEFAPALSPMPTERTNGPIDDRNDWARGAGTLWLALAADLLPQDGDKK